MSWLKVAAAIGLLGLSACSTLSEDECVQGDWYAIGLEDGAKGYSEARLREHSKACSEYGILPQRGPYFDGRARGLRQFCVPRVGFKEGARGDRYEGVCPADLAPGFLRGYELGQIRYAVQKELDAINAHIHDIRIELDQPKVPQHRRQYLYDELEVLSRDAGALSSKLHEIDAEAELL